MIFEVEVRGGCSGADSFGRKTLWFKELRTGDKAAFNWLWVHTGIVGAIATQVIVWSWDLFIFMAKAGWTGNWKRQSSKERVELSLDKRAILREEPFFR